MANNAAMYDLDTLYAAGIDPKAVLPKKHTKGCGNRKYSLKPEIKKLLRIADEQVAVNRGTWYNLPEGVDADIINRIMYYRGQGALFKIQDKFYFLPFTLAGSIDVYGRFTQITPLPFNGTSTNPSEKDKPWINGLVRTPQYDVALPEDFIKEDGTIDEEKANNFLETSCVILRDYTPQLSQTILPRAELQEPILDMMAEMFPMMRTSLINGSGVRGLKVSDDTEVGEVERANEQIVEGALTGSPYTPIKGTIDFQDLTNRGTSTAQDYLLAMQALDNFRLSMYGIGGGELFEKKAHMLQSEQASNMANTGLILQDTVSRYQMFCSVCNSIWGTAMWYEPSEVVLGVDMNGDGIMESNEEDPNGTAPETQPTPESTEDEN